MPVRVVLMSDIHGNLPALQAVADALPDADEVVVAGDLCLEGPCPAQVLDFLSERGWTLITGNTDRDLVDAPRDMKDQKRREVEWTRAQLGEERLRVLASLPFSHTVSAEGRDAALVVHANPLNLEDQLYPTLSEDKLEPYLQHVNAEVLAFGHLHIPYVRPVAGTLLIDISSVGHPKDGDRRAAFTVLTLHGDRRSVEQVRVPYDIDETVRLLHVSGMPFADEESTALRKASY